MNVLAVVGVVGAGPVVKKADDLGFDVGDDVAGNLLTHGQDVVGGEIVVAKVVEALVVVVLHRLRHGVADLRQVEKLFPVDGAEIAQRVVVALVEGDAGRGGAAVALLFGQGEQRGDAVVFFIQAGETVRGGVVALDCCCDGVGADEGGQIGRGLVALCRLGVEL